jgi:hypothetical protein
MCPNPPMTRDGDRSAPLAPGAGSRRDAADRPGDAGEPRARAQTCRRDSSADSGVLPLPETLESGSIRPALPRTGELSAGEANDEIARNAGAGVVPAAEILFQMSAKPDPNG